MRHNEKAQQRNASCDGIVGNSATDRECAGMAAQSIAVDMQIAVSNSYSSIGLCAATRKRFSDHKVMATGPASAKTCIVGLGDPVVDVLVKLSAQNFDQLGLQRGGSVSLHASEIDDLLEQVDNDGHRTRLV